MSAKLDAWRDLCARVNVAGVLPVTFSVQHISTCTTPFDKFSPEPAHKIVAIMRVLERDDNSPATVRFERHVPCGPDEEGFMLALLRDLARDCYMHECDEQFMVDGSARPFDPHAKPRCVR